MSDGVVEEVAIYLVLGDDLSKEGLYRSSGGGFGVSGVGWFVESDFLDPKNFFVSSGGNGWCGGRVA